MSSQDPKDSTDGKQHKSTVNAASSPSKRAQGFQKGANVKMKVTEDKVTQMKPFTIAAASQRANTTWQYQLNSTDDLLWDGGKWFPEIDIKSRN